MAGGFDEREEAMEAKWAHDEELRFRAITRRNKLLARWAAGEMGLKGAEADAYEKAVLDLEVRGASDEDIVQKLQTDFAARKIVRSDHLIRLRMQELAVEATDQIMRETKS
jgi:hypothetical protein